MASESSRLKPPPSTAESPDHLLSTAPRIASAIIPSNPQQPLPNPDSASMVYQASSMTLQNPAFPCSPPPHHHRGYPYHMAPGAVTTASAAAPHQIQHDDHAMQPLAYHPGAPGLHPASHMHPHPHSHPHPFVVEEQQQQHHEQVWAINQTSEHRNPPGARVPGEIPGAYINANFVASPHAFDRTAAVSPSLSPTTTTNTTTSTSPQPHLYPFPVTSGHSHYHNAYLPNLAQQHVEFQRGAHASRTPGIYPAESKPMAYAEQFELFDSQDQEKKQRPIQQVLESHFAPRARRAFRRSPRTSKFRGVTRHRRSGKYEAHGWSPILKRQIYLGSFTSETKCAEAHDIFALKCKGDQAVTNFPKESWPDRFFSYLSVTSHEDLIQALRRQATGFARGGSQFRGVIQNAEGDWEAYVSINSNSHLVGVFRDEIEAARAFDNEMVLLSGHSVFTNYAIEEYLG